MDREDREWVASSLTRIRWTRGLDRVRPFVRLFFFMDSARDIFYRYILTQTLYSSSFSSLAFIWRENRAIETHGLVQGSRAAISSRRSLLFSLAHIRAIYILHPNTAVVCLWSAGIMRSRCTQRRVSYAAVEQRLRNKSSGARSSLETWATTAAQR